jgi:hypothetical protein
MIYQACGFPLKDRSVEYSPNDIMHLSVFESVTEITSTYKNILA